MYDKFVDNDGKTTLNIPEYMQLRKDLAKKKEQEKKVKQSKQKKKDKL
jgi:hypothetical protein